MLPKVLMFVSLLGLLCLPDVAAAQSAVPNDTVISLQRGNCEVMECPIYRLVIFANGDVIWQGRGRVAKVGVLQSRMELDRLQALIKDFQSIEYFNLENIYGFHSSGCTSWKPYMPMVITSFSMGGLSKTLSHHAGCVGEVSDKLSTLEDSIDRAANTARWIADKPSAKH
jgi:hypothetical protein